MNRRIFSVLSILSAFLICCVTVSAHVPYFEHRDFSETNPFVVRGSVEQSIAVYAWLETDFVSPTDDVDMYQFEIGDQPQRVYIEAIVPVAGGNYANFTPWFALFGPDLPEPNMSFPFDIPDGYGVVVGENVAPGAYRSSFYEFFGRKWYYKGPVYDQVLNVSGTYYIYYWDPDEVGGDYVGVIGRTEFFGLKDIIRAFIYTPLIRRNLELHLP